MIQFYLIFLNVEMITNNIKLSKRMKKLMLKFYMINFFMFNMLIFLANYENREYSEKCII